MNDADGFLKDFHWLMDILQNIDVGLVVLDRDYKVSLWNSFMQNHSAKRPEEMLSKCIFEEFPELPEKWFRRKADSVFTLQNSAFTTWEQRPYLFHFESYRPITSIAQYMYQNSTLIPLKDRTGKVDHICLIVYDVTEMAVNRIQIQEANETLKHLSRTDGLTGLLNRKSWEEELESEFQRYARYRENCSLLIFDIDHFKKVNDGYGHPAGDEVIRLTARLLKESLREIDIAGRYGGEEFVVILVNTDANGAKVVAERLRQLVETTTAYYENFEINYTVSLGIAQLNSQTTDRTQWIDNADKALYEAKQSGRNNSVIFKH